MLHGLTNIIWSSMAAICRSVIWLASPAYLHGNGQADALLVLTPEVAAAPDVCLHLPQLRAVPVCLVVGPDHVAIAGQRLCREVCGGDSC